MFLFVFHKRLLLIALLFFLFPFNISASIGEWSAHVIAINDVVPINYIEDYATSTYGNSWDFDKEELASGVQPVGAYDLIIRDGRLSFKTSDQATFTWGDMHLDNRELGEEHIGDRWKSEALPWVVRVKLRQSLNESSWFVDAGYREHTGSKHLRKEILCKGKDEQILTFPMGRCFNTYFAFCLGTHTPGNNVSIDWIRIERPSATRYFRKSFYLSEQAISNQFSLGINARFKLYINGVLASHQSGQPPFERRLHKLENIAGLRKGKNVIAIETEEYGSFNMDDTGKMIPGFMFIQGCVATQDGKIFQLQSDISWKGNYRFEQDWEKPSFVDTIWSNVVDQGSLHTNQLDGFSSIGKGHFREPPYTGRISVSPHERNFPFFTKGDSISFDIHVLAIKHHPSKHLHYSIRKFGFEEELQSGHILLTQGVAPYVKGPLDLKELMTGAYNLTLAYQAGDGTVDKRDYEFVVAGKIFQPATLGESYEDGLSLRLVDSVDFTKLDSTPSQYTYGGSKRTGLMAIDRPMPRVINTKKLKYLETGARRDDWFSFIFHVNNPYRPHLATIRYPDDDERNMVFMVGEPTQYQRLPNVGPGGGLPRATPGVITGGKYIASGKMKEIQFIFWPNETTNTLTVVNAGRSNKERGAASSLVIHEVTGDLPACQIPHTKTMIGPFVERIDRTTPMVFYAGELQGKFPYGLTDGYFYGFYSAWYTTIENLIKYLRFSGQNTYFAGVYMYSGGWIPSTRFQGWPESGFDYLGADWKGGAIELMATMFAANDLNLILGVQFIGSKNLFERDSIDDNEVADGKSTNRFVTATGRQKKGFQGEGFNFLMPDVREEMLELADEISVKYSTFPAVKGITWMRLPEFRAGEKNPHALTGLDIGYDDATIHLFEQETGITIPSEQGDRQRFNKRYQWLMQNFKEEWINWRCQKVHDMDMEIHAHLTALRKNWGVWHLTGRPDRNVLRLARKKIISQRDIYRYQGIDPLMYGTQNTTQLVPFLEITGDRFYRDILRDTDADVNMLMANLGTQPEGPFLSGGVFLHTGFLLETQLHTDERTWPWQKIACVGYPAPANDDFIKDTAGALVRTGLNIIPIGWSDAIQMLGNEQAMRTIAKEISTVQGH